MRVHDPVMTNVAVWSRPDADIIHNCVVDVCGGRVHSVSPMTGAVAPPHDTPVFDAGAIEPGMVADFTLVEATTQPVSPKALSRIAAVVKSGRVIYESKEK